MKQEALFRKLGNILAELNEQYQFLSQNPEHLSELELELFMANAHFLVDHIQIIKKLNPSLGNVTVSRQVEINTESEKLINAEVESLMMEDELVVANSKPNQDEPTSFELTAAEESMLDGSSSLNFEKLINTEPYDNEQFEFEAKPTQALFDRKLTEDEERILAQKKRVKENLVRNPADFVEDELGPEPFLLPHQTDQVQPDAIVVEAIESKSEAISLATTPSINTLASEQVAEKRSMNDILAAQNNQVRVNDATTLSVTDLKTAISLNDKLLFIKELFNGYNLAYSEAINLVNKMPNFDSADNFLQKNYAEKNDWSNKQAAVDKFYLILNRRFKE